MFAVNISTMTFSTKTSLGLICCAVRLLHFDKCHPLTYDCKQRLEGKTRILTKKPMSSHIVGHM